MDIIRRKNACVYMAVEEILHDQMMQISVVVDAVDRARSQKRKRRVLAVPYGMLHRIPDQVKHLNRIIGFSDVDCLTNLRMDRNTFGRLCLLLRDLCGLKNGRFVSVEEQVALFLSVLAHHKKNRVVKFDFWRSGQTVSHYIHVVLRAVLRLHGILLVRPTAVQEASTDPRWKWFKGCLGALDGTYINVMVPNIDKPRYRTRKGQISTNTLAVCDKDMKFVYVLPGWEGSAADARILRDALNRPNGLKVPRGSYYLVDNGYANSEGFLAPYKGVRYHLKEWGPTAVCPQNAQELFNMRHTKARNIIERAFGVMKMRWGILRSSTFYPVKVQNRLIMACFLLNNFIRTEMDVDPIEQAFDNLPHDNAFNEPEHGEYVDAVESSPEWAAKRDAIARSMWQEYVAMH
ncbi:protein ALP1-like [Salvia miltiorrhiza]|uniref:protein ALP1-like n=1 Tax=Salvia miltiorrhiza TaxID=226208 RepID=UPI0025ACFD26|nr:protein ALP1-like [Salvia miltiorrhiza]